MKPAAPSAVLALVLLLGPGATFACSLGKPPPTAEVLVARSDAIYVATAVRYAALPPNQNDSVIDI